MRVYSEKKRNYMNQMWNLIEEYKKIIIVNVSNVGSSQFGDIRKALRGKAVLLMGKNTLMKKAISKIEKKNKTVQDIKQYIKGNVGLVFTNSELGDIKKILEDNKVPAAAKQGQTAPNKVVIPAQNTGQEPTKTSFFQALNIQTKITRGTVEIVADHVLLNENDKVGSSEAALLQMLNIKPFAYGLVCKYVYDNGSVYDAKVLDITENDLFMKLKAGISNVAALSLAINYPTEASIPHSVVNSFKNLLAVSVETDYTFPEAQQIKEFLKDPSKFVTATPTAPTTDTKPEEEKKDEKEEEEEEEDVGGAMNLFGGGDDSDDDE